MIKPHHRVFACFFLFAVALGALLSRLPDLQRQLGLTESELGLMMIGMSVGSLVSLTLSAPWIERMGPRTTAWITVLGTALLYAVVPWLPNAPSVFALMLVIGFLAGMLEINLNVETDRIESTLGRRIMSRAHGFWSLGFFFTALAGAAIRQAGISIQIHTGAAFVVVLVAALFILPGMRATPQRAGALVHEAGTHRIALPNLGLLPFCLIAIAALLIEGAGVDWSAIYMRDVFHSVPFIGGLGLTLFTGFMAVARLTVDPVADRFGPRAVVIGLLSIAAAGALLVFIAPYSFVALIGFALMGAGSSGVYPLAVSAVAQRTDRPAAVNVAALGQMAFVTFFLAPPLLGFVAQYFGIRFSYAVCLPVVGAALLASGAMSVRNTAMAKPSHA